MKVQINADDFGNDENRTLAIVEAWRMGFLTSTTLMANCAWAERAMQLARENGFLERVGLHLNLTEGRPLTERIRHEPLLCDEDGTFNARFHLSSRTRLFLPRSASEAIAEECEAQVRRFLSLGGVYLHLDSHHHVHTDFSVARVVFPIIRRFGFRSVRKSRTLATTLTPFKRVYKLLFNLYAQVAVGTETDDFTDFPGFVAEYSKRYSDWAVEIMVHPLYDGEGTLVDVAEPIVNERTFLMEKEVV